ncbi:alpha/beta-Hydrolase [Glarea lozoyensis ATCC 20868]|uniref:Alpha/beta-Hydrolase n=1 Tax=Glarea lozoyensis (strain ATCC 20868 / MF5171) TaxID=1116229 RepID=S3DRV0_GLAL2|nr:alpha/beta-Hydrolase [Glarea lozoyensis ATCC 20868]EPE29178.1 alpha/beta-Hydrolase [Glarea lozoyensis ATCC 20868]
MAELFQNLLDYVPSRKTSFIIATSAATTLILSDAIRRKLNPVPKQIIPSPRASIIPSLSYEEQDNLPYPPNLFPGARDVDSPYGTTRIYEWGPEDGRKVLLIHGISTPCLSLGNIAHALVQKGCRVILLDLFGRGYSDSPDLPHDSRLYTTQILLAITSSPLSWTLDGFSIIGYSLGGGIAADFAAFFPHLIQGLVLLAPAGLIRPYHFGWQSKILYNDFLPTRVLEHLIRKRLMDGPSASNSIQKLTKAPASSTPMPETAVAAEVKGTSDVEFRASPLNIQRPNLTVASAVGWQLGHHEGFVRSFVSSIRYSSISGKNETWRKLGSLKVPVLVIVGDTDPIIVANELEEDAKEAIGADDVVWKVVHGGHEFPITHPDEVVGHIAKVWRI